MKKFIVISLFVASTIAALACGPFARPNYYVFSVFPTTQWNQPGYAEMVAFWEKYTGKTDIAEDVDYLGNEDLSSLNTSTNAIIQTAIRKNDAATLHYLKVLIRYLKISAQLKPDVWTYPTAERLAQLQKDLRDIRNVARAYKNKQHYAQQYLLLEMRCNLALEQPELNKKLWVTEAYRTPQSVYRDMMKGLFAHALNHEGKRNDAIKIYAALGDMTSIKWLVMDSRNLQGIQREYAADANSPTLKWLVQDFVNNAQETKDNNDDHDTMRYLEATGIYNDEIRQFIGFARQVVNEGKTKEPALWQAAAGFLQSMLGNDQEALQMLNQAMQMEGSERIKDNARVCRLAVMCKNPALKQSYLSTLHDELKWLTQKDAEARKSGDLHYEQMIERFVYTHLAPACTQMGNTNLAGALLAFADSKSINPAPGTSLLEARGEYWNFIDQATSAQLISYHTYLASPKTSDLEQWLLNNAGSVLSDDEFNDLTGTKFIREANFQAAIPYLEKVPLSYISKQNISPYMAQRNFLKERWMGHQAVRNAFEPMQVRTNQKLDFCRKVAEVENAPQTPENAYLLASLLYQAGRQGDCWYLSRYGVSYADSVALYTDEALFEAQAIDLLREAAKSTNFRTKEKALYALAFIPQGEPLIYTDYVGKNYRAVQKVSKATPQYAEMKNLLAFYNANPTRVSTFVSKCDVLKQFKRLTTPKKKTARRR
ncbi:MAG: hypothetical protein ACI30R_02340 [Sodaliphilus sp.]